jgi:hypothetical protein
VTHRRAADHHLHARAQSFARQGLYHLPLSGHRGGEQRREADDVGVHFPHLRDEALGGDIHPEVVDLETAGGEHRHHQRLADLVDVSLDRAEDHGSEAVALRAAALHFRLEDRHRGLHGLAAHDQVGKEHLAEAELLSDVVHPLDEAPVDRFQWIDAERQRFAREAFDLFRVSVDDALPHGGEQRFMHGVLVANIDPRSVRGKCAALQLRTATDKNL